MTDQPELTLDLDALGQTLCVRGRSGETVATALVPDDVLGGYAPLSAFALDVMRDAGLEPPADRESFDDRVIALEPLLATESEGNPIALSDAVAYLFPGRTAGQLLEDVPEEVDWLIPGIVAPGWTIKLAAREKTGKGTLVWYLISCLERGEPTVFGPGRSEPVTTFVLTEEPDESTREKVAAYGVEHARIVGGHEFAGLTWTEKVARISESAEASGAGLVFVDNVSRAAGIEDESGPELGHRAAELADSLRARGIAGIIDHHHKKGAGNIADKSRGGTALAGAMDVNVEMEAVGGTGSRQRKLTARGRLRATNWERTIELSVDGTDYAQVGGGSAGGSDDGSSSGASTREQDIREQIVALLKRHAPQQLKTGQIKEQVGGNAALKTRVLARLASDPAEPVQSLAVVGSNAVLYWYDTSGLPEAADRLMGRAD